MATQVTNYQCPACTGPLHFVGESGKLECDYCGANYHASEIEEIYKDKVESAADAKADSDWDLSMTGSDWTEEEAAKMRAYSCPSCGAEIICDETTLATSCPYCGNPTVVPGQFKGQLKPDYILPFKLSKEKATEALKKHYKGKKFLPKSFSDGNHIEEIKGIYVPFWLFDGEVDAAMNFEGTKERKQSSGDEEIIITEYYNVLREGNITFEKIPVDGSSKMPDDHMDAIEPFDFQDLKPFSPAYLPGFLADKFDVDKEACAERANKRIEQSTEDLFASTAKGYKNITTQRKVINLTQGDVKYAMMPVWLLSTKWKGESFLFAMNGQTGKLIGDLPIDKGKFWMWYGIIALPLMAILGTIMFWGGGM